MALLLQDIKTRLQKGLPVSDAEKAVFIRNSPEGMAAFMIDNNPGSVNFALRKMGYKHLGFEPNKVALARQLGIFIDNNNVEDFNDVIKRFSLNEKTLSRDFVSNFYKEFSK